MTADLREAFHIAAVAYVGWHKWNAGQRTFGWLRQETNRREYLPEPTVAFFGKRLLISQISTHAIVLDGPLPPHIHDLFGVMENGSGESPPETYPDAAATLSDLIEDELAVQIASPLTEPAYVEKVRLKGFEEGATAAIAAVVEAASLRGGS